MYKGEETFGKFVVAGGDSAITLELLKKTFYKMSFLLLIFIKRNNVFAIAARFNGNRNTLSDDLYSQLVAIIAASVITILSFKSAIRLVETVISWTCVESRRHLVSRVPIPQPCSCYFLTVFLTFL